MPAKRLIANVEGAMNAVMVHGDAVGSTLFYGRGAGSEPTASAVVASVEDLRQFANARQFVEDSPWSPTRTPESYPRSYLAQAPANHLPTTEELNQKTERTQ